VLDGQVAVVTGAARGIGAAIETALSSAGATVVGVDRDTYDLATDAVERLIPDVVAEHGRVDILVNNAGLARHNPIADLRAADIDLMWAVNARAVMLLCRDALRQMAAQGGGQIVNVVSTAGLRGGAGESAYCATKFAVRGFTEGLVDEARLCRVRVHGIYPAGVDTGFWADATERGPGVDTAAFLTSTDVAAAVLHALSAPASVHMPEVVVRAVADGDAEGARRKLEWFRSGPA
jgi:NADP-dependent 3-hydroxy acid dehydrogenase YdfG